MIALLSFLNVSISIVLAIIRQDAAYAYMAAGWVVVFVVNAWIAYEKRKMRR